MSAVLRVGDPVLYGEQVVKVTAIEATTALDAKYGDPVDEIGWDHMFVADLDNGRWARSIVLRPIGAS